MEEAVFHQEYVIVLMVGVEIHVPHVCKIICDMVLFEYMNTYIAVCPDGCFNGGVCTAPGTCTCSSGWTGNDCTQGKK